MSVDSREVVRIKNVLRTLGFETTAQIRKGIKSGAINTGLDNYGKASHKRICDHLNITTKKAASKPRPTTKSDNKQNGGPNRGQGRKKGAATKRTRAIADKLSEESGITPLEYMMDVLNTTPDSLQKKHKAGEIDTEQYVVALAELTRRRDQAAKDAASYIHPRLSSVEAHVKLSGQDHFARLLEEQD